MEIILIIVSQFVQGGNHMAHNDESAKVTKNLGLTKALDRFGLENPLMEINGNWDIIDNVLGELTSKPDTEDTTESALVNNLDQLKTNLEGR